LKTKLYSKNHIKLGEKNEKDLFLVNANQEALRNDILNYNMYEYSYLKKLREYAVVSEETRKEKIAEFFITATGRPYPAEIFRYAVSAGKNSCRRGWFSAGTALRIGC